MKAFFAFETMITPIIIKILFWLGVIGCVIGGLVLIVAGFATEFGEGALPFIGVLLLLLGPILVRIYCEILIVAFQINDSLLAIRKNTQPQEK